MKPINTLFQAMFFLIFAALPFSFVVPAIDNFFRPEQLGLYVNFRASVFILSYALLCIASKNNRILVFFLITCFLGIFWGMIATLVFGASVFNTWVTIMFILDVVGSFLYLITKLNESARRNYFA